MELSLISSQTGGERRQKLGRVRWWTALLVLGVQGISGTIRKENRLLFPVRTRLSRW